MRECCNGRGMRSFRRCVLEDHLFIMQRSFLTQFNMRITKRQELEGRPTSRQSFWALITRPILYQPTKKINTFAISPKERTTQISSQVRAFDDLWTFATMLAVFWMRKPFHSFLAVMGDDVMMFSGPPKRTTSLRKTTLLAYRPYKSVQGALLGSREQ